MAYIYAKSPNGTTQSINIDTMNITSSLQQNGWCKLPNGLIFQWSRAKTKLSTTDWLAYPLIIEGTPLTQVGVGWTADIVFAFRCHDNIMDARMNHNIPGNPQTISWIAVTI